MNNSNSPSMKQIPLEERPREKAWKNGAESLGNNELLAILLRTGTDSQSVHLVADSLLAHFGGLHGLMEADAKELTAIPGIGPAKAIQIKSAIELGRRFARLSRSSQPVIRSPKDAADLWLERLQFEKREHFIVLHLDTKNRVIGEEIISIGSLDASIVHPREVFKLAIRRSAASILCLHNHPSGDPTPSREDISVTKRLSEAGKLLGIEVLDHLIIGEHRFISLKEQSLM